MNRYNAKVSSKCIHGRQDKHENVIVFMGDEHWTAVSQEKIPKDPYADGRKTTAFFGKQQKTVNCMEI